MKRFWTYLSLVILVCSCGLEEETYVNEGTGAIEFTASRMRVVTKAGDQAEPFAEGTDFRLFAVQSGTSWDAGNVKFYNITGTEDSNGYVDYAIDGKKASYDVGKNLDFYGLTYGTSESVAVSGSAGSAPEVHLSIGSDGTLADLMYSDNLKNRNSSSGVLRMEFRHAMARLGFEILKQDESSDNDKKLENVVLKKVVLKGSAAAASFNLDTKKWEYGDSDVADRLVYENNDGLKVQTTAQTLKDGEAEIDLLVIPNSGQLTLQVTLDLDGNPGTADDKVVDYVLTASETELLALSPNHRYTLSIAVLKNDVRIVTVTPRVYEWIDVNLGPENAYIGQPIYFGGLMWMDRNLGATSADCENDWYNTLGYYYQFGRNIPYMLDIDKIKAGIHSFSRSKGTDDNDPASEWNMRFFYTFNDKGEKVSTAKYANNPDGSCYYDNLAKNPGDPGEYSFIVGFTHASLRNRTQSWAITKDSYSDTKNGNQTYWNDVRNQPCPRGWRLPTKDDLYVFMPEDTELMWEDQYVKEQALTSRRVHIHSEDSDNKGRWDYEWSYFASRFKVDPNADKEAEFSLPVSNGTSESPRVYGIKYSGTGKAYRVMFERIPSKTDSRRTYVRISRFDTDITDSFKLSSDGTRWNLHKFDWTTPAEYMDIPLCGYVHKALSLEGGAILRTSEAPMSDGLNWVMYLRSGSNGVCVTYSSRRNLGENIRCVRDINAK